MTAPSTNVDEFLQRMSNMLRDEGGFAERQKIIASYLFVYKNQPEILTAIQEQFS